MTTADAEKTFVTNIYAQRLSWIVARYLLEASPLSRGFQVRAHGYTFPVLRADSADLERLLRRDLPEMIKLTVWDYSIAITSTLPEAEVLARLRVGGPGVPGALTTAVVPGLLTTLTVFPCGFGVVEEDCGSQFFRHDLPLDRITDESQLREAFWQKVNRRLPVPFYDGPEPQPKPLTTLRGTAQELAQTLEALGNALTEKWAGQCGRLPAGGYAFGGFPYYVISAARSKRSSPKITLHNYRATGDLARALEIISRHYHPVGTKLAEKVTHHSHAGHEYSNFKLAPLTINFTAPDEPPPARVRMAALGHIRRWFEAHASGELGLIAKLCGEFTTTAEAPPEEDDEMLYAPTPFATAGGNVGRAA